MIRISLVSMVSVVLLLAGADAAAKRYPYQSCFEIAAKMHKVPLDLLLAVAATESNWNPDARSNKDAHGIMQIQWPGTARHLGIRRVSELYNPCLNIELGARYLRELLDRFAMNETKALAAYNYGPGRIAGTNVLPEGAAKYAATVAKHRVTINRGFIPAKLQPNQSRTLVTFDSRTRARHLADKLDADLVGATVSSTKLALGGYAVVLSIGVAGLTVQDRAMLTGLGWSV